LNPFFADFVILFFTEILFYVGISLFLFIAHKIQVQQAPAWASVYGGKLSSQRNNLVGYRVSMIISVALGVVLPAVSFAVVWPWTGPAAAAALLPYLLGLAVQLVCEKVVQSKQSPVWPLVPITFQVLNTIHRAVPSNRLSKGVIDIICTKLVKLLRVLISCNFVFIYYKL
jgi:hypothetical protein